MPLTTSTISPKSDKSQKTHTQVDLSGDILTQSDLTRALQLCENASPEQIAIALKSLLPDRALELYSTLPPETHADLNRI